MKRFFPTRENIQNHIGELGDRDERELLRYSRIAQQQAEIRQSGADLAGAG